MRKTLLLVALLATGDAFAFSLDIRVPSKPVCDRIDPAPANSVGAPIRDAAPAPAAPAPGNVAATVIPAKTGGSGLGHVRPAPRWQSFLPGMFK